MEYPSTSETNGKITTEDIIQHLMQNKEVYFKSQQIGEEDLSLSEKETIAKSLLDKNKCNFLSRFGKYLKLEHLEYFKQFLNGNAQDDSLNYHYNNLLRFHTKSAHAIDVRNRRFEALKKLIAENSYFSETEMMKRNPLLYDQLIGKYLTEDERKARDSVKNKKEVTFVNILMEGIERDIAEHKKMQQKLVEDNEDDEDSNPSISMHKNGPFAKIEWSKLSQKRNEDEEVEEDDSEEDAEKETVVKSIVREEIPMETTEIEPETSSTTTKRFVAFRISPKKLEKPKKPLLGHVSHREDVRLKTKGNQKLTERCKKWGEYEAIQEIHPWKRKETQIKPENIAISIQERSILRDEFLSLMYQSFLDGKDDFDYSTVDINEEYDNAEIVEQDAEEKYFESESPNEENDDSAALDRFGDRGNGNMDTNSSEDELDMFMERLNRNPTVCQLSQDMKNL